MSYIQENPYSYDMYQEYEWYEYVLFIFVFLIILYYLLKFIVGPNRNQINVFEEDSELT